jgi:HPt (histidine-containing phosphotransfer) domain-containing protein
MSTKRFASHTLPWVATIGLGLITAGALLLLVWHMVLQDHEETFAHQADSVRNTERTSLHWDEFHHGLLLAAGIAGLMMTALCTLLVRSAVARVQELQQRHEESERQVARQTVILREQAEALAVAQQQALAMVDMFLHDTYRHLEGIQEAVLQGDSAVVLHLAHTLKGTSSNLGAWRLAELCEEMVAQCRTGALDGAAQQVAQLQAEYARVQAEFGTRCAAPSLASLGEGGEGRDDRSTGC